MFDHKNFDQFLNSKIGKEYFLGVIKAKENVELLEKYGSQENLKNLNEVIDLSKYNEDDYIVPLA